MPNYPIDYSKGIVYTIMSLTNPSLLYVGSTTSKKDRERQHRQNSKKDKTKLYQMIRDNGGWKAFIMDIYIEYPCNNKEELRIEEERCRIELEATMNKNRCYLTREEYENYDKDRYMSQREEFLRRCHIRYLDIKEYIQQYNSLYYIEHKDELLEYQKKYAETHKPEIALYHKGYRETHKEELKEKKRIAYQNLSQEKKDIMNKKRPYNSLTQEQKDNKNETRRLWRANRKLAGLPAS